MKKINFKKIKGYSLVEMLVTMAIFGIIIAMLLQSLFLNIKLTTQINLRSKFNTDLDQLVSLIERDIRNADFYYPLNSGSFIKGCTVAPLTNCTLSSNDVQIKWYLDSQNDPTTGALIPSVKRAKVVGALPPSVDFISTNILNVEEFEFYINSTENLGTKAKLVNILVTIKVKPTIDSWTTTYGINEQVRQISVSTRNYEVKF